LDHHALQTEAESQRRDPVPPGVLERADLALDAAYAEPTGNADRVDVAEEPRRSLHRLALVRGDPTQIDPRRMLETPSAQGFCDRKIRIWEVDVLADQGDRDLFVGVVHPLEQLVPAC